MDSKATTQRIKWIDYCRAIAIMMVVMCHAVENVYDISIKGLEGVSFLSQIFAFTAFAFGRLGVPLFLMLTGYLLLDREYNTEKVSFFWKKRWLNLLISTLVWFLIYDLFIIFYLKQPMSITDFFGNFIFMKPVRMPHVWFMSVILALYILIPFVAIALQKFNTKILAFPVVIFTVFCFLMPTINQILEIFKLNTAFIINFSEGFSGGIYGLYVIFGYLLKKGLLKNINSALLTVSFILFFALSAIFQIWAYHNGTVYKLWYNNILLLAASVLLFELLSRMKISGESSIVTAISKYSFAVYLIHHIIIWTVLPIIWVLEFNNPLKVICLYLISFVASLMLALLISFIPKIGKYILFVK